MHACMQTPHASDVHDRTPAAAASLSLVCRRLPCALSQAAHLSWIARCLALLQRQTETDGRGVCVHVLYSSVLTAGLTARTQQAGAWAVHGDRAGWGKNGDGRPPAGRSAAS